MVRLMAGKTADGQPAQDHHEKKKVRDCVAPQGLGSSSQAEPSGGLAVPCGAKRCAPVVDRHMKHTKLSIVSSSAAAVEQTSPWALTSACSPSAAQGSRGVPLGCTKAREVHESGQVGC